MTATRKEDAPLPPTREPISLEALQNGVYEVPADLFAEIFALLGEFPAKYTLKVMNRMTSLRPKLVATEAEKK